MWAAQGGGPEENWRIEVESGEEVQVDFGLGAMIDGEGGKRCRTWVLRMELNPFEFVRYEPNIPVLCDEVLARAKRDRETFPQLRESLDVLIVVEGDSTS